MIIFAVNINSGGGQVILDAVLKNSDFGNVKMLYIDSRSSLTPKGIKVIRVKPGLTTRLLAEVNLQSYCRANPKQQVLFFGNLPPILKINADCKLFLQNAYLLKNIAFPKPMKQKLRYFYERFILYTFIKKNIAVVFVQTDWMKSNFEKFYDGEVQVMKLLPIFPNSSNRNRFTPNILAITGPEPHKNLPILQEALNSLNVETEFTIISPKRIGTDNQRIKLNWVSNAARTEVFELYQNATHLIVLSDFESFCLPLYEAKHFKLKIIAPLKGYITKEVYPDFIIQKLTAHEVANSIDMAVKSFKKGNKHHAK